MDKFSPMHAIPHTASLTMYSGKLAEFMEMPLEQMLRWIGDEDLVVKIGKVFKMEQIAEAHEMMERNEARGKLVILTA